MIEKDSDSSPHASLHINALPLEVLDLIIRRHIDRNPLLHFVSLVCKRWRRLALASITKLCLAPATLSNPVGPATLAQLSGLTDLRIYGTEIFKPHPLHFPPSLTKLRVYISPENPEPLTWLVMPPLRQLHLHAMTNAQAAALFALSSKTLEELTR